MSSGFLRIWIKRDDEYPWGILETLTYDDNARKAFRRRRVLKTAIHRVYGWRANYSPFANASFSIEEQESEYSNAVRVWGAKRQKPKEPGKLVRKLLDDKKAKPKPKLTYKEKERHQLPKLERKSIVVEMPEAKPARKNKGGLARTPYIPPAVLRAKTKAATKAVKRWVKSQSRNWKNKDKGKAAP